MSNVREMGMTVEDFADRVAVNKQETALHAEQIDGAKRLLGTGYEKGLDAPLVRDARRSKELKQGKKVFTALHTQSYKLESKFNGDNPLIFPEVPAELLNTDRFNKVKTAKLEAYMMPDLSGLTPEELQKIADGYPSPYLNIFPKDYLIGMAKGAIPLPTEEAYFVYADKHVNKSRTDSGEYIPTPLVDEAGFVDFAHKPITEVKQKLYKKGEQTLEIVGFDSQHAVKPLSTKEAAIIAFHEEPEKTITNTRIHESQKHIVFTGEGVTVQDGNKNGIPTRLGVLTRRLQPDKYLRPSGRR